VKLTSKLFGSKMLGSGRQN